MKRLIKASYDNDDTSNDNEIKYGIGLFVDNELVGYFFRFTQSRGSYTARFQVDVNWAKTYNTRANANRALSYYNEYNEIYLYKDGELLKEYMHWRPGFLETNTNPAYDDINRCELKVIEL